MKGKDALALLQGGLVLRDPDKSLAYGCYLIEKETSNIVTPDFPATKYMEILKFIKEERKREEKELKKSKRRGKRRW